MGLFLSVFLVFGLNFVVIFTEDLEKYDKVGLYKRKLATLSV